MPSAKPRHSRAITPLGLTITAVAGRPYVTFLRRHLLAAHARLSPPLAELSVALVGDARMATLHQEYLNIPGPTDVLTFPLDADARGRVTSGEVVVCVPEARRRAKAEGTDLRSELLLYALHGMLHLCGFDDRTDSGYRAMHRAEDDILTHLGVGPVFAASSSTPKGRDRRTPAKSRAARSVEDRARRRPRRRVTGAD